MKVFDFNGGDWAGEAILLRYAEYCKRLKINNVTNLTPLIHVEGDKKWIYPVMDIVIEGIEQGDAACKQIGIEFIEQDQKFSFGKILKSNTARALRRAELSEEEKERIRKRLISMLLAGNVPHEYKQYSKLLKKIGLGSYQEKIEKQINRSNRYVMRYYQYLMNN